MTKAIKGIIVLIVVCGLSVNAWAQTNYNERYERGKDYFKNKIYDLALEEFKIVSKVDTRNPYAAHASFYYALSKYYLGEIAESRAMLLQIKDRFDDWDQLPEVDYWLAMIAFEQHNIESAFTHLSKLNDYAKYRQAANRLKEHFLFEEDSIQLIQNLLEQNPYDSTLAELLAYRISQQEMAQKDMQWADFLMREFGIKAQQMGLPAEEKPLFRQEYRIAVLLPFLYKQLDTSPRKKSNQFILDLYNGIRMAVADLEQEGVRIKLYAFDTERDSTVTAAILAKESMKGMDLIVGPLFPQTTKLVNEFSQTHKIVMVNPLSTNSGVIGTNPYSYLYRSSAETQAKAAAQFAIRNFDNKNAFVIYSLNDRDLVFAEVYAEELAKSGFSINMFKQVVDAADAKEVLEILTEVHDEDKGDKSERREIMYNQRKVRVGEGDSLIISRDSIGHIMLSSRDNLLVANVMSGLQSRADSIPIIGFDEWLEFDQLTFNQFQQLNISMLAFNFTDFIGDAYISFKRDYIEKNAALPTQFSYHGYEMMWFFGKMLGDHGKYFGNAMRKQGHTKGRFFAGFDYSQSNDNLVMPIVELDNFEMVLAKEKKNSDDDYRKE